MRFCKDELCPILNSKMVSEPPPRFAWPPAI
ncbi:hypothetical protein A2U01_0094645, partial [Trifolium medium]|nr:hypothetical protein [Trifolium medium]